MGLTPHKEEFVELQSKFKYKFTFVIVNVEEVSLSIQTQNIFLLSAVTQKRF